MVRIAFVCQDLIGQGVQFATATMVRAFVEHGYAVDLVVSKVHSDLVATGLKPFDVPACVHWVVMPSRRSSRNWRFLRKYLREGGADIIVAETRHYVLALSFASIGLKRIPLLYQVEHINVLPTPKRLLGRMWLSLFRFVAYWRFKGVLVVNEESRRRLLEQTSLLRHDFSVYTVYNAVVDDDFLVKRSAPTNHPWLRNKECPTFVAAGALHEGKGFDLLLEAMRVVNEKTRVRLVLFGRGGLESAFKKFVEDHHLEDVVSIAGYTDNLPAELKSADSFVSSSHAESFSIVLAQALALGIPCISTDVPLGPREVLANGLYGKLVPPDNVDLLARAILDYAVNPPSPPPPASWSKFTIDEVFNRYASAMNLPLDRRQIGQANPQRVE